VLLRAEGALLAATPSAVWRRGGGRGAARPLGLPCREEGALSIKHSPCFHPRWTLRQAGAGRSEPAQAGRRPSAATRPQERVPPPARRLGNGINWKGQVFPRMRNFTDNNRMTGVGNALKRLYQRYLVEYEQARPRMRGVRLRRSRTLHAGVGSCLGGRQRRGRTHGARAPDEPGVHAGCPRAAAQSGVLRARLSRPRGTGYPTLLSVAGHTLPSRAGHICCGG